MKNQTENTTQIKNRGGRPRLNEDEIRCIRIQPSFTLNEFEEVKQRADAIGVPVSEWLKIASLGKVVQSVPAVNRAAYSDLSALSSNLNQLTRVANTQQHIDMNLIEEITTLKTAVSLLRAELLGAK